jgi:hypothetical protein
MGAHRQAYREVFLLGVVLMSLVACSAGSPDDGGGDSEVPEENSSGVEETVALTFRAPANCTDLLPDSALEQLNAAGIDLVRGPGSASSEPVFIEGQTPEELVGGLSCLFTVPNEDEGGPQILLSVAAVSPDARPGVINGLLDQELNVGQSNDGALTYWKWGDEVGAAEHNALYQDSWYSAILQPGGRSAYDQGVDLVSAMRSHTTE